MTPVKLEFVRVKRNHCRNFASLRAERVCKTIELSILLITSIDHFLLLVYSCNNRILKYIFQLRNFCQNIELSQHPEKNYCMSKVCLKNDGCQNINNFWDHKNQDQGRFQIKKSKNVMEFSIQGGRGSWPFHLEIPFFLYDL